MDLPLVPPPPGVKSNFIDPESRANELFITAGICLGLIALFASLRGYAKLTGMAKRTWDDGMLRLRSHLGDPH